MGDRTNVSIDIRKIDYDWLLRAEFGDDATRMQKTIYYNEIAFQGDTVCLEAWEINYAEWDELENLLHDYFIEYDKGWGAGGNYSSGNSYHRLINGELRQIEIYENAEEFTAFIKRVKDLEADEIKRRVTELYKELMPFEIEPLAVV